MKIRKSLLGALTVAASLGLLGGYRAGRALAAGIPGAKPLTYSGTLTDANGAPLTGMKAIQVVLLDAATGAAAHQCGDITPTTVTLAAGTFQIPLPDACKDLVQTYPDLWTEVFVDGTTLGRTKLGAVPYSVEAAHATRADTAAGVQPVSAVRAVSTVQQTLNDAAFTQVIFGTAQFDLASEYNTTTGVFTAKENGYFVVTCQVEVLTPTGTDMAAAIVVNGNPVATGGLLVSSAAGLPQANSLIKLNTGDVVRCDAYQRSGAARTLNGVADRNYFTIARLY